MRVLGGTAPNMPAARRVVESLSVRGTHPAVGSDSILQTRSAGVAVPNIVSLNSLHTDGSMGMLFCWAVPNFGWGTGEF